jgi:hypothetical protein
MPTALRGHGKTSALQQPTLTGSDSRTRARLAGVAYPPWSAGAKRNGKANDFQAHAKPRAWRPATTLVLFSVRLWKLRDLQD